MPQHLGASSVIIISPSTVTVRIAPALFSALVPQCTRERSILWRVRFRGRPTVLHSASSPRDPPALHPASRPRPTTLQPPLSLCRSFPERRASAHRYMHMQIYSAGALVYVCRGGRPSVPVCTCVHAGGRRRARGASSSAALSVQRRGS